jgi:hypothetical protein
MSVLVFWVLSACRWLTTFRRTVSLPSSELESGCEVRRETANGNRRTKGGGRWLRSHETFKFDLSPNN